MTGHHRVEDLAGKFFAQRLMAHELTIVQRAINRVQQNVAIQVERQFTRRNGFIDHQQDVLTAVQVEALQEAFAKLLIFLSGHDQTYPRPAIYTDQKSCCVPYMVPDALQRTADFRVKWKLGFNHFEESVQ